MIGKGSTSFSLKLKHNQFNQGNILPSKKEKAKIKIIEILRRLGFYKSYTSKVISDPIYVEDGWEYKIKIEKINYHAFGLIIYKTNYK